MLKRGYKCRHLAEAKWVQRMVGQLMEWVQNLGSEKNTHSNFLSYLHMWWVDLNKNCS